MVKEKKLLKGKISSKIFGKYFKYIAILIVIVIFVAAYFLLLAPKYKEVSQIGQKELATRQQIFAELEKYLSNLKLLENNFKDIRQHDLDRLATVLPKEKDLPGLFVQVETIAKENGFTLLNVDFSEEANAKKKGAVSEGDSRIKKVNISFSVNGGNYASLIRFLDVIEHNIRIFDVPSLNFVAGQPLYSFSINTYYLVD